MATGTRAFLTPDQIAAELGVSRAQAYTLIREMRHVDVGRPRPGTKHRPTLRVAREDFTAWLSARTLPGTPSKAELAAKSLGEAISADRFRRAKVPRAPAISNDDALTRPIVPRTKPREPQGETATPPIRLTYPRTKPRRP